MLSTTTKVLSSQMPTATWVGPNRARLNFTPLRVVQAMALDLLTTLGRRRPQQGRLTNSHLRVCIVSDDYLYRGSTFRVRYPASDFGGRWGGREPSIGHVLDRWTIADFADSGCQCRQCSHQFRILAIISDSTYGRCKRDFGFWIHANVAIRFGCYTLPPYPQCGYSWTCCDTNLDYGECRFEKPAAAAQCGQNCRRDDWRCRFAFPDTFGCVVLFATETGSVQFLRRSNIQLMSHLIERATKTSASTLPFNMQHNSSDTKVVEKDGQFPPDLLSKRHMANSQVSLTTLVEYKTHDSNPPDAFQRADSGIQLGHGGRTSDTPVELPPMYSQI